MPRQVFQVRKVQGAQMGKIFAMKVLKKVEPLVTRPLPPSPPFCDSNLYFYSRFLLHSVFIRSPLLLLCRLRLRSFAMPKTRPTHEQSGRSWRRWDTRSLWICSTPSRPGGSSTSYWSIWVVRHRKLLVFFCSQLKIKPLRTPVFLFLPGGEVFMQLEKEGIFLEDTAW